MMRALAKLGEDRVPGAVGAFREWQEEENIREDEREENLDVQIFAWVMNLNILPTSRRTYFLVLLGHFARMRNCYFPETPRLQRMKNVLKKEAASHNPQRAPIVSLGDLPSLISPLYLPLAQIAFLFCARVGNLDGVRVLKVEVEEKVKIKYKWEIHKTLSHLGPKIRNIVFPPLHCNECIPLLISRQGQLAVTSEEKKGLEQEMEKKKMKKHTLRRSGLQFYRDLGLSVEELMLLSLHTNVETLILYLN